MVATLTSREPMVNGRALQRVFQETGPLGLSRFISEGLRKDRKDNGFRAEQISLRDLGLACGAIDPFDERTSLARSLAGTRSTENVEPDRLVMEAHREWDRNRKDPSLAFEGDSNIGANMFPVVTGQLLGTRVIEAYQTNDGYIADSLVTVLPNQRIQGQRLAGFTAVGGPNTVLPGHQYEETGFSEKYVTTLESKKGRILSVPAELIHLDQTMEIMRRCDGIGQMTRQEQERVVVRGVIDADSAAGIYVYRPSGTGAALYVNTGANHNYIGTSNTTNAAYDAAVALTDWRDVQRVRTYRATCITDDRIDGTQRAIGGINSGLTMLVSEAKIGTAGYIVNATEVLNSGATTAAYTATKTANPIRGFVGNVLSSPFVDEAGTQAALDWHVGNFKKQFIWTEMWPIQTFTQGADSESAFSADIVLRLKVRYWGGLSATDTVWVTKVLGA